MVYIIEFNGSLNRRKVVLKVKGNEVIFGMKSPLDSLKLSRI